MKALLVALAPAATTAGGAFVAWLAIRNDSLVWPLLGAVVVLVAVAEVALWLHARTMDRDNACAKLGLTEALALASTAIVGIAAAAVVVYIGADVIGIGTPDDATESVTSRIKSENKALAAGLAAFAAVLTTKLVDTIDSGVVGGRVKQVYRQRYDNEEPFRAAHDARWKTRAGRRQLCAKFAQPDPPA